MEKNKHRSYFKPAMIVAIWAIIVVVWAITFLWGYDQGKSKALRENAIEAAKSQQENSGDNR